MIGKKKKALVPTAAPVESEPVVTTPVPEPKVEAPVTPIAEKPNVVQVPVYLSQDHINNMVIETHLMVKEILAIAQEE